MDILKRKFYTKNTLVVARELLGKTLCRRDGNIIYKGKIVETEAYTQDEPACHAFRGKTPRAKVLFDKGGICYVYFVYGMHYCVNVVTEKEGFGAAVLIRALEPIENLSNTNGPAKLTKEMNITKELNNVDMTTGKSDIWIEDAHDISDENIIQTVRIGIKAAVDLPWRFYIKDNKWVSKK